MNFMKKEMIQSKIPLPVVLILMFGIVLNLQAQSVKRESISCYGSSVMAKSGTIAQTVGQPYNTTAGYDSKN